MSVSINNSKDLIVNSIRLIQDNGTLQDINEVISDAAAQISGTLSETSISTIEALSSALNDDPLYFQTTQAALDSKAPINNPTFTGTVSGITKSMVGLSNVDNTSDLNKPISTATQSVLNTKANIIETYTITQTTNLIDTKITELIGGAPETLNTLNEIAAALNDDANIATTLTNQIATKASITSPSFFGTVSGIDKSMVGLSNVDNTSDLLKPISQYQQLLNQH